MIDRILDFDRNAFLFINSKHSPFWDDIMWWVSGSKIWIPLYVLLLIVIVYRELSYRVVFTVMFLAVAVTLSDQLSNLIKILVERPRPTWDSELMGLVHKVNDYKANKPYGFVSNHAANVFCLATFLTEQLKNYKWGFLLFLWAIIVSYSRIYLGVHYPFDVIFGALLGTLTGIQCYVFKARISVYVDRQLSIRKEKKEAKRKAEERKAHFS